MKLHALTVALGLLLALPTASHAAEPLAPLEASILGTVDYNGGYLPRARVTLNAPMELKRFRVAIPGFCGETEILEAGTVTEGIEDVAAPLRGEGEFEVNGGAGLRVSAVWVTFNGPLDASCVVPIMEGATGGDPSGRCDVEIRGTTMLADTSYPMQAGWGAATVGRFLQSRAWSTELVVDGAQPIRIRQPAGACHAFVTLSYDRRACGSDFLGETNQSVYVGESISGGRVTRLFGFLTRQSTWNRCVTFLGDIVFNGRSN